MKPTVPTVPTVDSADRFALEFASFGPSVVNASNDGGGGGGGSDAAAAAAATTTTTVIQRIKRYCMLLRFTTL